MTEQKDSSLHDKAKSSSAYNKIDFWHGDSVETAGLKHAADDDVRLSLFGVDHTARPTWKLRETVEFYRDVLGLPMVHAISARGWGREGHPDFLHFFFDAGKDALIAFFYYIGTEPTERYLPEDHLFFTANHTAWAVETREELEQWKVTLEARGVQVSPHIRHEILESIYFSDPNGYPIEITLRLRDVVPLDQIDAALTIEAAMQLEDELRAEGSRLEDIDTVWRRKGKMVQDLIGGA